jgi:hypothetical protein
MSAAPAEAKPRLDLIAAMVAEGWDVKAAEGLIRDLNEGADFANGEVDPTERTADLLARLARRGRP